MKHIEAQLIHDMRNAASVIRGAADTLHGSAGTLKPEAIDHIAGMLSRRSDMLVRLLEDLAIVHQLDRGELSLQLQRVDVESAVRDYVDENGHAIEGSFEVVIDPDSVVIADPVRLSQILDNLLSNAARYGGPNVTLRAWPDGGMVRIAVSDDGPGVAPDLVDTLFDLYSRGSRSREIGGSGLGLAIVQQLCAAMGGTIAYDDTDGTTFVASLPAIQAAGGLPLVDPAGAGHSVSFWVTDAALADAVSDYAALGISAGEAVVLAVTPHHRDLVEARLVARGVDVDVARALGQYLPLDAEELTERLQRNGHIDPELFDRYIGDAVTAVGSLWRAFRVFGEIVDVYWRAGEGHLTLELEARWNRLRTEVDFPLYCGYEVGHGQHRLCDCHDAVLVA